MYFTSKVAILPENGFIRQKERQIIVCQEVSSEHEIGEKKRFQDHWVMNCNGLCTLEQQNYGIEINLEKDEPKLNIRKGPFKYYVIKFFTFLDPPTHLFDDLQYCKLSKIAIFWPHPPTLMT